VLRTFPHIEDQLPPRLFRSASYNQEGVEIPGNPERKGGPHIIGELVSVMPQWGALAGGDLTDDEILADVRHERHTLGGADPTSDEYVEEFENRCADGAPGFVSTSRRAELWPTSTRPVSPIAEGNEIEITIGDVPVEGSPPGWLLVPDAEGPRSRPTNARLGFVRDRLVDRSRVPSG